MNIMVSALIVLCVCAASLEADPRPDSHAPISVMGDHTHRAGGWMLGYRYMFMDMRSMQAMSAPSEGEMQMDAMRHSDVSPTGHSHSMDMQMHMAEVMYAPADSLTLMAMVPFFNNEMDHSLETGSLTTRSEGIGDASLTALINLITAPETRIHLNLGMSFPTGDYDDTDNYHDGPSTHPYHMKVGSGTYDLLPGITYTGFSDEFSWGLQPTAVVRLGRNGDDYSLGDRYRVNGWGAVKFSDWISSSLRLSGEIGEDANGEDEDLTITGPMADPDQQGYRLLELGVGLNVLVPKGDLKGERLAVEFSFPLAQNFDDGVHKQNWSFVAGWQYAF